MSWPFVPGAFALRVAGLAALGIVAWWLLRPLLVGFVRRCLAGPADAASGQQPVGHVDGRVILACVFAAGMTTVHSSACSRSSAVS